jgi:hypothetical protein
LQLPFTPQLQKLAQPAPRKMQQQQVLERSTPAFFLERNLFGIKE